jgi:hypothetical protein
MSSGRRLVLPKVTGGSPNYRPQPQPLIARPSPGAVIGRTASIIVGPKGSDEEIMRPEVGICMACDDPFYGPEAIRLLYGQVYYQGIDGDEPQFRIMDYQDGTVGPKWLCLKCADQCEVLSGAHIFEISRRLERTQKGWCGLCNDCIEPFDARDPDNWSGAIRLELGIWQPAVPFHPTSDEKHFHWHCLTELGLDMDMLVPDDDAPSEEDLANAEYFGYPLTEDDLR